jgi:hypothetical protein
MEMPGSSLAIRSDLFEVDAGGEGTIKLEPLDIVDVEVGEQPQVDVDEDVPGSEVSHLRREVHRLKSELASKEKNLSEVIKANNSMMVQRAQQQVVKVRHKIFEFSFKLKSTA